MMSPAATREQVVLSNLLTNGYDAFASGLLTVSAQIILWSSFKDGDQLLTNYWAAAGKAVLERHDKLHLLDKRRRRSEDDLDFLEQFEDAADQAAAFRDWAKSEGSQPIFRESLVSYCSYFERLQKTIAVVFLAAQGGPFKDLSRQIYVPSEEWRRISGSIEKAWGNLTYDPEESRPLAFARRWMVSPIPGQYAISTERSAEWDALRAAFKLRNSIVHSFGRPHEQIQLGQSTFDPGWEIDIRPADLRFVRSTFLELMKPFSTNPLDTIL